MFGSQIFNCVRSIKSRFCGRTKNEKSRRRPSSSCLSFEQLEDRRVLSANTVSLEGFGGIDADLAELISAPYAKFGYELASLKKIGQTVQELSQIGLSDSPLQLQNDAVAIQVVASGEVGLLSADLEKLGMVAQSTFQHLVMGYLPFSSIAALAALNTLRFATPLLGGITSIGTADTQGDEAQRSNVLRDFQGLDGTGITVGVISDSFDNGGAGAAATDIVSGDLPGVGNPEGFLTPVNVIQDNDPGTDEGRAMLQLVHDVAPNAGLAFANVADNVGVKSQIGMADNIRALAANANPGDPDADVIVDDWIFFAEPFFMDGFVAQAVNDVVDEGAVYVSAARNLAADSYDTGVNTGDVKLAWFHDFTRFRNFSHKPYAEFEPYGAADF